MLQLIPRELQELAQWVCAGEDKVPLNPRNGRAASVIDATTWGTFEEAVRSGYKHIGFVLTAEDPYTIIDLDATENKRFQARHDKMIELFDSYTEFSQSGAGKHIIVRGSVPTGARKDKVEVYSTARYMICTGNVFRDRPITDKQSLLETLFSEMRPAGGGEELTDEASLLTDDQIIDTAMNAANGDKFNTLCRGEWQGAYDSQSEADFALLSIIAFYTHSNDQVRRLFRMSALGKRDKAQRDKYLNTALSKIRGNEPPPVNIEHAARPVVTHVEDAAPSRTIELLPPPGLVGEVAQYVYSAAVRPVEAVGLAAAISFVAGVAGRSYNISSTGLNQYVILLAPTGSGKEGAASGIESLISAIRPSVPMVDHFIGPSAFASGQALVRVLDERPCFVSVLGELGWTPQHLCDGRANPSQLMLRRVLLDLYTKSGWNNTLRSWVYSDNTKNTNTVKAPCVTILGESTPESFYHGLDSSHIAEGLIPRFSVIEYRGKRPPRNEHAFTPPDAGLTARVSDLVVTALHTQNNNTCAPVQCDPLAMRRLSEFDVYADERINGTGQDAEMQLWNRAHLKALKMSALLAVGNNPHQPIIGQVEAAWAVDFVTSDIERVLKRFSTGEVGQGDQKKESDVRKAIDDYFTMDVGKRLSHKAPKAVVAHPHVIPFAYIRSRTRGLSSFKQDRLGAGRALQDILGDMVAGGVLQELPAAQVRSTFGINTQLFTVGEGW